ncbi:ComEC/Rec2 family competence protein [Diplocloster hominis]|uniref:ComEC/Rec2 family competence protein n=1 Tax=Diplocloster hominis TaxID=3079010 RepID=UPI0031BB34AA
MNNRSHLDNPFYNPFPNPLHTQKRPRHSPVLYYIITLLTSFLLLTGCTASPSSSGTSTASSIPSGTLEVHYLDVGQADCTLLLSQDAAVMIDAGNRDDAQTILQYLDSHSIDSLDAIIFTHPHEDHIGAGADLLDKIPADSVYMNTDTPDSKVYKDLVSAAEQKGLTPIHPSQHDTLSFGDCRLEFLQTGTDYEDTNDNSLILKVTHGENRFLFTGDAGQAPEKDLAEGGVSLEADVFQAGHHGSEYSNSYVFLRAVNPPNVVISCGRDNSYGHPHEAALSRFRDVGATVYRTDTMGTVTAFSDGTHITFDQQGIESDREHTGDGNGLYDLPEASYIGNVNSKKFHTDSCPSLPAEKNRVYFNTRDEALDEGYEPCQNCKP